MKALIIVLGIITMLCLDGCATPINHNPLHDGPYTMLAEPVVAQQAAGDVHRADRPRAMRDARGWDCVDYAVEAQRENPGTVLATAWVRLSPTVRSYHMVAMTNDGLNVYDQRMYGRHPVPWWQLHGYEWALKQCADSGGWCTIEGASP